MRIVYITPEFPTRDYFSGGLANYLLRTGMALHEQGHEIHMVVKSRHKEQRALKGIHLHYLPPIRMISGVLPRRWKKYLKMTIDNLEYAWSAYRYLLRLFRTLRYDIVQFSNYMSCGLFSTILPFPVPVVTRISSFRPAWNTLSGVPRSKDLTLTEWLEKVQLEKSKNLFCPSTTIRDLTEKTYRTGAIDIIRTPFFSEVEETDASLHARLLHGKPYVLFIGRLQLHKGIRILIDSLPAFLNAKRGAHVVLAGIDRVVPGLGITMEQYAGTLEGVDMVRLLFLGQVPHARLYPIIQGARLVVLPSLIDNLPNTLLEAMAFSRPVIGTIGASFDEVITDNVNGFLVPAGNSVALAKKMIEVWDHPDLESIGQKARQDISEFYPDRIIPQLMSYYKNARK